MLMDDELELAHRHCGDNRGELALSDVCGCFYCLAVFAPQDINHWVDEAREGLGTALCPRCGIDSVVGSASGYAVADQGLLSRMQERFFVT